MGIFVVFWKLTAVIIGLLVGAIVISRLLARVLHRKVEARSYSPTERCHCGYDLTGLDLPRCPECGSVIGFDKTFSELGIDESEVREHLRKSKAGET